MYRHQLRITLQYYDRRTNDGGKVSLQVASRYRCIARLRGAFVTSVYKRRLLAVAPDTIFTSVKHRWV